MCQNFPGDLLTCYTFMPGVDVVQHYPILEDDFHFCPTFLSQGLSCIDQKLKLAVLLFFFFFSFLSPW